MSTNQPTSVSLQQLGSIDMRLRCLENALDGVLDQLDVLHESGDRMAERLDSIEDNRLPGIDDGPPRVDDDPDLRSLVERAADAIQKSMEQTATIQAILDSPLPPPEDLWSDQWYDEDDYVSAPESDEDPSSAISHRLTSFVALCDSRGVDPATTRVLVENLIQQEVLV